MKNKILIVLILVLFFFSCSKVFASELCSPNGYSIFTINGIFTNEKEARENKDNLKKGLFPIFNNEPLTVDFLYNPSHLAGLGDLTDVINQGFFNQQSDYDLVEMLNDASQKVRTQKLLLVAHSQGNFYANSFYDKVASQEGGVPSWSIGVYGVATPTDRVAGGGKYLTSDTDSVIASTVARFINILSPNVHIPLQNSDGNGHSFSDVYLKYQGNRIVSDIKSTLNKLEENDEQLLEDPCISPPELTTTHKVTGVILAVADPLAGLTKNVAVSIAVGSYKIASVIGNSVLNTASSVASIIGSLGNKNNASVILANNQNNETEDDSSQDISSNKSEEEIVVVESVSEIKKPIVPDVIQTQTATKVVQSNPIILLGGGGGNGIPPLEEDPILDDSSSEETPPLDDDSPEETPFPDEDDDFLSDTTPPVISIIGDNSIDIFIDTNYIDAGATATDDTDEDISVITTDTINTSTVGTYTVTYTASDLSNNTSTEIRTINVIDDNSGDISSSDLNENGIDDKDEVEVIMNEDMFLLAGEYRFNNLIITNNTVLTFEGDPDSLSFFKGVKIEAINLTINPGSSISADGKGYVGISSPGYNSTYDPNNPPLFYAGGSYGGIGYQNSEESLYGSATEPVDFGSAGYTVRGIARGGGAIRLIISNNFINDGIISADGDEASSGGSIYVTSNIFSGSGNFHADGGAPFCLISCHSPGGGGRVAIYYQSSTFSGETVASGWTGTKSSEDGTVGLFDESLNDFYVNTSWQFRENDAPFSFNNIFISNGANIVSENNINITANNLLIDNDSSFTLADSQILNISTITINGESNITFSGNESINTDSLTLAGNSILTVLPEQILYLNIPNLTINSGSSISADGKGYLAISSPGYDSVYDPNNPSLFYAGGSYGGIGYQNSEESLYGSATEPVDFGSAGYTVRGIARGGGAIRLIISNNFINDGIISADGDEASSGGSIYVTSNIFSGSGNFHADGGAPFCLISCHSPGGGGRVAIYYQSSTFSGETVASGWTGTKSSEDGTVTIVDSTIPVTPPDTTPPLITNYTFNEIADNITTNPLTTPLSVVLSADENVNWMSIQIEDTNDSTIYKRFLDGVDCEDGTDTCSKTWDGALSNGGELQNGTFHIKVHMQDEAENDYYGYLSPYVITVDTSL